MQNKHIAGPWADVLIFGVAGVLPGYASTGFPLAALPFFWGWGGLLALLAMLVWGGVRGQSALPDPADHLWASGIALLWASLLVVLGTITGMLAAWPLF